MRLLTLPRDAFLEVVTGHPRSHQVAHATVEQYFRPTDVPGDEA
jgi:hypothetical protein